MVRVKLGPPAAITLGLRLMMAGIGGVTTSGQDVEAAPSGLITESKYSMDLTVKVAGTNAVTRDALSWVVANGSLSSLATDPGTKPAPLITSVMSGLPST